jgi:hypothetical protein
MDTLRARQITDSSPSFLEAVRRIMKEEPELTEGAAMNKARDKNNPSGKRLYNQWCEAGRPGTL